MSEPAEWRAWYACFAASLIDQDHNRQDDRSFAVTINDISLEAELARRLHAREQPTVPLSLYHQHSR
jgi:hypothetical protein